MNLAATPRQQEAEKKLWRTRGRQESQHGRESGPHGSHGFSYKQDTCQDL